MTSSTTDGMRGSSGDENAGASAVPADMPSPARSSLKAMAREAARQAESRIILETLQQHHWNRRRTAEALKISYRSLMYKMKYCNIRDGGPFDGPEAK